VQDKVVLGEIAMLRRKPRGSVISDAALEIHVRAVARSVHTDCPAFISYADLDDVAPGPITTMAALELCMAELWLDARNGYVIADLALIERLSAGSVDLWFRRAASGLARASVNGLRKLWRALNDERFIPL
jgi:hypothetical protein